LQHQGLDLKVLNFNGHSALHKADNLQLWSDMVKFHRWNMVCFLIEGDGHTPINRV
jgi:hypothetical protein